MKQLTKKLAMFTAAFALVATALFVPVTAVSANGGDEAGSTFNLSQGVSDAKGDGVPETSIFGANSIFNTVVNFLLFLIGALSVIMLIWGGIRYATSAGNSASVTAAKNTIMYAVIGLVVAFLAYAIVNWVLTGIFTVPAADE